MKPHYLCAFCLFACIFFFSANASAQSNHYHSIAIKTDGFTAQQAIDLTDHLANEMQFILRQTCPEKKLLLIEFPTTLPVRIPTAESMILNAVELKWNQKATIERDLSRDAVMSCITD